MESRNTRSKQQHDEIPAIVPGPPRVPDGDIETASRPVGLVDSQEFYQNLLEELECIVFEADARTWRFTYVNQCAEKVLGYPVERWYEDPDFWVNMIHPDDRHRAVNYCLECTREGRHHRFEYRALRADGRTVWIADIVHVVVDEEGRPLKLRGVMVDVTESKQMQDELRRSEVRFRSAFEQAAVGMAYVGADGKWLRINQKLAEILGYSKAELEQRTFQDVTHPDDQAASLQLAAKLREGTTRIGTLEKRYIRKDGTVIWANLTTALVTDTPDDPGYYVSVVEDISERKRAQEALRESEDRLRRIFDHSNDAIFLLDPGQNEILDANPKACSMFGYTYDEILNTPVSEFHPEDLDGFLAFMGGVLDEGQGWTDAFACRARDGRFVASEISASKLVVGGRTCVLALVRDVTERKRTEAQLQELNRTLEQRVTERTAELEEANRRLTIEIRDRMLAEETLERTNRALQQSNRELEDFAHAASHDLQEPLRKISSFVDLLTAEYDDRLDENGRGYLERIQAAALRMSRLIRDLLDFSRVKSRGEPFRQTDLNIVVNDVLLDLDVRISEVRGQVMFDRLPVVAADATQMRQLFQNLISNGLKFHREGTPPIVRIMAEPDAPSDGAGRDAAAYRILVADNGIGFDEKYLSRIFTPFQRLHGRTEYPGTGVGLAICRRIVDRHGGTITAQSRPGEGSTFIITLPAQPAS